MILRRQKIILTARILGLCICVALNVVSAELKPKDDITTSGTAILQWLQQEQEDFYFNPKMQLEGNTISVKEAIDESELLMVIPSNAVMSVEAEKESKDSFCKLAAYYLEQLNLGDKSDFAPYLRHTTERYIDLKIPNLWSTVGKRLLWIVDGEGDAETTPNVIDWIQEFDFCKKQIKIENSALEAEKFGNSEEDNVRINVMAITARTQVTQQLFVPLYDLFEHHHVNYNVDYLVEDDGSVTVQSIKSIALGETLYRPAECCLGECTEPDVASTLDVLRNYGHVPPYPHLWDTSYDVSFIYYGDDSKIANDKDSETKIEWIDPPEEPWQFKSLEWDYNRHQKSYKAEIMRSKNTVPSQEWNVIKEYSLAIQTALQFAIKESAALLSQEKVSEDEEKTGENECDVEDDKCVVKDETEQASNSEEATASYETSEATEKKYDDYYYGDDDYDDNDEDDDEDDNGQYDPWKISNEDCSDCEIFELSESRKCKKHSYTTMHNATTFTHMRAAYVAVMGSKASLKASYGSGIRVAFKIDHSPGRGRGIFAMEDIKKGTLVWHSEHTAAFTSGEEFRNFLQALPDVLVCDLLIWCYTSRNAEQIDLIECDLDEGSLINSYEVKEEYTVGCEESMVEKYPDECIEKLFALRDIQAGEELLTDYADFSTAIWGYFGL